MQSNLWAGSKNLDQQNITGPVKGQGISISKQPTQLIIAAHNRHISQHSAPELIGFR